MLKTKYLIIGGGPTGLSFAKHIQSDDYILVEKESQLGGLCKTIHSNGFVWDYAGHFYHFKNEYFKKVFFEEIGPLNLVHNIKNTKIYLKKKMIDYPFQMNIRQLSKKEMANAIRDLKNCDEYEDDGSFLSMIYKNYGKTIAELFLKPYNEKLYACNLNNLDKNAMGRFFPAIDKKEILNSLNYKEDKSYNNIFWYPKDGAGAFVEVISKSIPKANILFNSAVIKVDAQSKIAFLSNGNTIQYDFLINTVSLKNFANMLNLDFGNDLTSNKVLCFNIGFKNALSKESKFDGVHWVYFPEKELNFYRVGFYNHILHSEKLSLYVEIGFDSNVNIDVEREFNKTLKNLKKVGIFESSNIIADFVYLIINPAYVHINSKSEAIIQKELQQLSKQNIYSIGRYGLWTYCSIEDSMEQARELARRLNDEQ